MIIYKTTCTVNGKIYIGQSKYDDPSYIGSGSFFLKAVKKHRKENFVKEVLEYLKSKEELDERETYWISYFKSNDPDIGYNLAIGGHGNIGYSPSDETRKKISISLKGRVLSEEHKEKISSSNLGNKHSDETKQKMSYKKKGVTLSTDHIENIRKGHLGVKQTEESKKKRSEKLKGRIMSEEHKKKLSDAAKRRRMSEESNKKRSEKLKGRKFSEETLKKMSESLKGKNKGKVPWNKGKKLNT